MPERLDRRTRTEGRKLALAVADYIDWYPEDYNQDRWGETSIEQPTGHTVLRGAHCGTPACVAGWAIRLAPEVYETNRHPMELGKDLLGLDDHEADWLFAGFRKPQTMPHILRHYGLTGELVRTDYFDPPKEIRKLKKRPRGTKRTTLAQRRLAVREAIGRMRWRHRV